MVNKQTPLLLSLLLLAIFLAATNAAGDCPSSTKVLNCTPKCLQDSECSSIGGKCCPNLCNARSCVQPNQLSNSGIGSSNKYSSSGGSGSYCGNVKCGSYQKCEMDRSTKRPMCVRA